MVLYQRNVCMVINCNVHRLYSGGGSVYYRKLHLNGIGCTTKKTELLTRENEEKLWQTGVLNPDSPQGLLNCFLSQ